MSVGGRRERAARTSCPLRGKKTQQLVTDPVGNASSQFVLLIAGLAEFAHYKVHLSNMIYSLAAEDSAGALWPEKKVFADGLSNFKLTLML